MGGAAVGVDVVIDRGRGSSSNGERRYCDADEDCRASEKVSSEFHAETAKASRRSRAPSAIGIVIENQVSPRTRR